MWILEFKGPSSAVVHHYNKIWLCENCSITVGRKDCSLNIREKSVSRTHARIDVGTRPSPTQRSSITVIDLSKFGTWVDGNRCESGKPYVVDSGAANKSDDLERGNVLVKDTKPIPVRFGVSDNGYYDLRWEPLNVCVDALGDEEAKKARETAAALGVTVTGVECATLVLAHHLDKSPLQLRALALSARFVVPKWLDAMAEASKTLVASVNFPREDLFLPPLGASNGAGHTTSAWTPQSKRAVLLANKNIGVAAANVSDNRRAQPPLDLYAPLLADLGATVELLSCRSEKAFIAAAKKCSFLLTTGKNAPAKPSDAEKSMWEWRTKVHGLGSVSTDELAECILDCTPPAIDDRPVSMPPPSVPSEIGSSTNVSQEAPKSRKRSAPSALTGSGAQQQSGDSAADGTPRKRAKVACDENDDVNGSGGGGANESKAAAPDAIDSPAKKTAASPSTSSPTKTISRIVSNVPKATSPRTGWLSRADLPPVSNPALTAIATPVAGSGSRSTSTPKRASAVAAATTITTAASPAKSARGSTRKRAERSVTSTKDRSTDALLDVSDDGAEQAHIDAQANVVVESVLVDEAKLLARAPSQASASAPSERTPLSPASAKVHGKRFHKQPLQANAKKKRQTIDRRGFVLSEGEKDARADPFLVQMEEMEKEEKERKKQADALFSFMNGGDGETKMEASSSSRRTTPTRGGSRRGATKRK